MREFETQVMTSDTDWSGTQTLLSAVTMMQNCSMLWMDGQPELRAWLKARNAAMMVASREMQVFRRPAYGEQLSVKSWVYKMRGPLGYRNSCIFDEQGEVTSACWAIGVFVGLEQGRTLKVPPEIAQSMMGEARFENMAYGKRKIALPDAPGQELPRIRAQRSDIDFNGHVNNAQYVRMAYEFLPQGFDPQHLRIMHEGQAKLSETIVPTLYQEGASWIFTLNATDGKPFAIVEFE